MKTKNRIWSLVLSAMLSIEQIAFAMPVISKAATSANHEGSVPFPSVSLGSESARLNHDDTLVDNGDGTFTFTSKITADYSFSDISMSRLKSTDGEYPLDKAGKYLIELWGGDGGDGSEFFPMSFKAGKGGAGGFVYGMLDVSTADAGTKKLVYEIGSKGESETRSITGGGTDGIGGGAGDVAIFSVGAGGGYSAVYLVDQGVTIGQDVPNVSNLRDDPSKVLMIAGGGGGGGAGASLHSLNFLSTIFGGEGKANGGDGGYAFRNSSNALETSGISATPSIGAFTSDNVKVGKYYAGENGSTSGTKSAYVGQGGTDRPGEIVKSFIGFIEASSYPNDWQRIFHSDAQRGIGGRGNFRGGGGGAGFAGGSGGLQNEPLEARNIGGGGGGSSYVAAGASDGGIAGFTPFANISTEQQSYFVDKDKNTNAATGGAVVIRYLPANADYSYLENVTIEGTISDYFDITGTYINSKSTGNTSGPITVDENNKIRVSGSIAPKADGLEKGQANDALTISLKLKPKDGFAGGNNVPIFADNTFSCVSATNPTANKCDIVYSSTAGSDVTHVNVPYNLNFKAKTLLKAPTESYIKTDLYDSATNVAGNPFFSVDSYTVNGFEGGSITLTSDDIGKTKEHTVTANLTLANSDVAEIGTANGNKVEKTAYVKCVAESPITVDDFSIAAKKKLEYNDENGTYDLSVDMNISKIDNTNTGFSYYEEILPQENDHVFLKADFQRTIGDNSLPTPIYEKLGPGYYFVEAYGADGGKGGERDRVIFSNIPGTSGGSGAYISRYLYLPSEVNVEIYVGKAGFNGGTGASSGEGFVANLTSAWVGKYYPGGGGQYSGIKIGDEYVLLAGGGGGGGTAYGKDGGSQPQNNGGSAGDEDATGVRTDATRDLKDISCGEDGYWDPGHNGLLDQKQEMVAGGGQNRITGAWLTTCPDNAYLTVNNLNQTSLNTARGTVNDVSTSGTNANIKCGAVRITKLAIKGGYKEDNDANYTLSDDISDWSSTKVSAYSSVLGSKPNNFKLTETFSKYFDFVLADVVKTGDFYKITSDSKTDGTNDTKTYNIDFEMPLVETADYFPIEGNSAIKTTLHTYNYSMSKDVSIKIPLTPRIDFLGGNDVPLLTNASIKHENTTSGTGDDEKQLTANVLTDYANVEIPELDQWKNGTEPLPSEVIVPYGGTLSQVTGFSPTITNPTSEKTWETEFVKWNETRSLGVNDPVTSEGYLTLTGSLNPKNTDPDAVVIPKVDGKSVTEKVKIRLKYNLTQTLTGFESSIADNTYEFTKDDIDGDNLVVELTMKSGYDPKQNYVVSQSTDNEGNILYNVASNGVNENGNGKITITIPKSDISKNIKINAIAVSLDHMVKFMYQVYDGISISTQEADGPTYSNGAEIDASDPEFYPFNPTSAECPYGYDAYDWDWPIEPNAGTTSKYTMGESDIYVVGTYRPKVYKLVVDYKAKNDEDKADFESKLPEKDRHYVSPDRTEYDEVNNLFRIALTKGTDYFVRSPEVQGYFPNHPLISGTVDDNAINNYLTEDITVNGKTYKGHTETVTYEKIGTDTNLIINFIECDAHGNPINNGTAEQITIGTGDYDEDTTAIKNKIDQYMASDTYEIYKRTKWTTKTTDDNPPTTYRVEEAVDAIEGTAVADVVETYYVYYIPKRVPVTVNFNAVDINADKPVAANVNISDTPRTVIKGREYGYDYVTDSYIGLPRAVCTGFVFEGWYTSDDKRIEDDTIVEGTGTIELYAHWRSAYVTITINYNYANNVIDTDKRGKQAAPSWVSGENGIPPLEYGMSYNVTSPKYNEATPNVNSNLNGYTSDPGVVKGVALQPETLKVFYTDDNNTDGVVKLRVDVYSSAYNDVNDQPTSTHKISRGTFILLDQNGNEIANSRIENNNGTLEWTDVETKIAAGGIYTIKCVDPPTGYGVTEKPVTLDQETTPGSKEYHFNFFLDKSPFQLPMAGSKPMTGYTVFGISAMLLAGLLMFAYVNSRTEENNEKE